MSHRKILKNNSKEVRFMNAQANKILCFIVKIQNKLYVIYQILISNIFRKKRKRILFSNHEIWKNSIKRGFKYSEHEISFGDLSKSNLQHYDLVIPLTILDLEYLAGIGEQITKNPIPIPSKECIALCNDKYLFNQKLIDNGFGKYIPKIGGEHKFPYILKKRIDEWGRNSYIITDHQKETVLSEKLNSSDYFSQEIICDHCEYATHVLFINHEIAHSINIEFLFDVERPIKGKDKPVYKRICNCPFLEFFAAILTSIEFNGLCCLNYKVVDKTPYIFEINPRFGGSLNPYFFFLFEIS